MDPNKIHNPQLNRKDFKKRVIDFTIEMHKKCRWVRSLDLLTQK